MIIKRWISIILLFGSACCVIGSYSLLLIKFGSRRVAKGNPPNDRFIRGWIPVFAIESPFILSLHLTPTNWSMEIPTQYRSTTILRTPGSFPALVTITRISNWAGINNEGLLSALSLSTLLLNACWAQEIYACATSQPFCGLFYELLETKRRRRCYILLKLLLLLCTFTTPNVLPFATTASPSVKSWWI